MADWSKRTQAVRLGAVGFIIAAGFVTSQARASVTTFAQYAEQHSGVGFTKNGGTGTYQTMAPGGDPVDFMYTSYLGNLPVALQGSLNAMLSVTATTNSPANLVHVHGLGEVAFQSFTSISLAFTLPTDFIYNGVDYGNNLLTITVTPDVRAPVIVGTHGGHVAYGASRAGLVNIDYTSSFLDFANINNSVAFTSFENSFTLADGDLFFNPFGNMVGSFRSDPLPTSVFAVPEPSAIVLLGLGLLGLAIVRGSLRDGSA